MDKDQELKPGQPFGLSLYIMALPGQRKGMGEDQLMGEDHMQQMQ
jgi:hypothetical protein